MAMRTAQEQTSNVTYRTTVATYGSSYYPSTRDAKAEWYV
jgi:hypothetical protein